MWKFVCVSEYVWVHISFIERPCARLQACCLAMQKSARAANVEGRGYVGASHTQACVCVCVLRACVHVCVCK